MMSGSSPPAWLHNLALLSVAVAIFSALIIVSEMLSGPRPKMPVMRVVWPMTALYMGPVAVWAFRRFGTGSGKPFWQSVLTGDTHCGAGCTLGDFAGEWLVFLTGFTLAGSALAANYVVDFLAAYTVGIAFQYFSIAPMRHISGWPGIKAAMKADTISLIAFEVGMFAWMAFSDKVLFQPKPEPTSIVYWFSMQIAMIVGFATALPANAWLLRKGLKEPM